MCDACICACVMHAYACVRMHGWVGPYVCVHAFYENLLSPRKFILLHTGLGVQIKKQDYKTNKTGPSTSKKQALYIIGFFAPYIYN